MTPDSSSHVAIEDVPPPGGTVRLKFGGFELDTTTGELSRDGKAIPIQPKVYGTLRMFIDHPGQLISRQALLDALWSDVVVNEEAVTQTLRKLRRVLGDAPKSPSFIQTVPKRGYRFIAPIEVVPLAAPAPSHAAPSPAVPMQANPALSPPSPSSTPTRPSTIPSETLASSPSLRTFTALLGVTARSVFAGLAMLGVVATGVAAEPTPGPLLPGRPTAIIAETSPPRLPRRLTFTPGAQHSFDIAPDGASTVISVESTDRIAHLFRLDLDSGTQSRITMAEGADTNPNHWPGTRSVLFTRTQGSQVSVWMASTFSDSERLIATDAHHPAVSPNGKQLAFVRGSGESATLQVHSLPSDAQLPPPSLHHPLPDSLSALQWSHDGDRLAWVSDGSPWVMVLADRRVQRLGAEINGAQDLAWTPDDTGLVLDGEAGLHHVALGDARPAARRCPTLSTPHATRSPRFSADGQQLLYVEQRVSHEIWLREAGASLDAVLDTKSTIRCVSPSRTGPQLAFFDARPQGMETEIGLLTLPTSKRTNLALGADMHGCPTLTAADNAIVVPAADHHGAWWALLDGASPPRRIAADFDVTGVIGSPSPATTALRTPSAIVLVNVDDGSHTVLAEGSFGPASWSPDGVHMAAVRTAEGAPGIDLLNLDTRESIRIASPNIVGLAPIWRDDTMIDVITRIGARTLLQRYDMIGQPQGVPTLLVDLEGRRRVALAGVQRTHNGGLVYVLRRVDSDLMALPAAGVLQTVGASGNCVGLENG